MKLGKRRRKNEIFLPAFGAHLPNVPILDNYELVFYPIPNCTPTGFDLEYTSLLLSDGLVMDSAAYEHINRQGTPFYEDMRQTVEKLGNAGRLRLEDYSKHANEIAPLITKIVDSKLADYTSWIEAVREEWKRWKGVMEIQVKILQQYKGKCTREQINYGILCHLTNSGSRIKQRDVQMLTSLVESRRTSDLNVREKEDIREVARPYLAQVVLNQLLSQKLGIPFIDWFDLDPFHRRVSFQSLVQEKFQQLDKGHLDKGRELFTLGMNQLKPNSVDNVLRFMKNNRAVRSLRDEIQKALATDTVLDEKWAEALKEDAQCADITYRKRQQLYRWVSRALAPVPIAGPLIAHGLDLVWHASHIFREVFVESTDKYSEHASLSHYEWYYALLEMKRLSTSKRTKNR